MVAGLLIASISTSSPELFVGVSSALRGIPEISLGDVLGSNIANIALIFGIFLSLTGRKISKQEMRTSDIAISAGAPVVVLFLALDGVLSKVDGILLILAFLLWVRWLVSQKGANVLTEKSGGDGTLLHFAIGLAMLVVAGYAFTESAGIISEVFGMNLFLLSSVVVALGTSMPELATTIVALRTKRADLAIGNLLGSNVFNSLGILGLVALIQPIVVAPSIIALPVCFAVIVTVLTALSRQYVARTVGISLILLYVCYLILSTQL
jgi:cation:H+ antiporter